jgi:Xaa-Pro aminopeptidase
MADTTLQADSACANPDIPSLDELYAAWRRAKAEWDLATYSEKYPHNSIPDEADTTLCCATADALNRYLLAPAPDIKELARKLRTFKDEEIYDNWVKAAEIVAQIVKDAHRLAYPGQPHDD